MSGRKRITDIKRTSIQKDESFKSSFQSFQLLNAKKDHLSVQDIKSSKITLRFENPGLEQEFRNYYHNESYTKAKYAIAMALMVEFISSIFDFLFLLSQPNLSGDSSDKIAKAWPLIFMRYFVCLTLFTVGTLTVAGKLKAYSFQWALSTVCSIDLCIFLIQRIQYLMIYKATTSSNYPRYICPQHYA
jgi:hypothetical protein